MSGGSKITNALYLSSFVLAISCMLYSGCGSDPESEQVAMSVDYLQNAWEEYHSADYGAAILAFERALDDEDASTAADAYNGLGWVYLGFSRSLGINQKNIETALSKFQQASALDSTNADAWVGQAGLLLARRASQDDLRDALKAVDNAFSGNAEYLYRHDYDTEADLRALKAQCYYYLGEWDSALNEVNRVLAVEKDNRVALTMKGLL